MRAGIRITEFTLSDGTAVSLPASGTVLIVGPNNAGKSQALRDIAKLIASRTDTGVVVTALSVSYRGSNKELEETFEADGSILKSGGIADRVTLGAVGEQPLGNALQWWGGLNENLVAPYFVLRADTEHRLEASKSAESMNLFSGTPSHPLHHLYKHPGVEDTLSQISREAFGEGLVLDTWAGGNRWALRVGDIERPLSPRPSEEFLRDLQALPLLEMQGDGVRSLVGLLLELLAGHQSVYLLDEPEAFLHPPQARYLAKTLSEIVKQQESTTLLSTHSADVVHGTLEGTAATTVVRLVRSGQVNHASVLDNDAVRALWSDPLLRYSNLLEGLFTDAVIICESDADCKFFASMRDGLPEPDDGARRPDLLFTSVGGKHRMHTAVEALRGAKVPVAVIGDFDVLNDWKVLSRLAKAAGGDEESLRSDWNVLDSALKSDVRTPSVAGLREAVNAALDQMTEVTSKSTATIRESLKVESGWDRVKKTGLGGVPKGDPYLSASRLLEALAEMRIHLIPIGEMEDLVPQVAGHGPQWLANVLEQRLHEDSSTDFSRKFFSDVLRSFV